MMSERRFAMGFGSKAIGGCEGGGDASNVRMRLALAARAADRARGLLFRRSRASLLLVPCRDVHTAGMRCALDIAFLDEEGVVIEAHRAVGPMRRLRNRRAVAVLERPASRVLPWFASGDRIVVENEKGDSQ